MANAPPPSASMYIGRKRSAMRSPMPTSTTMASTPTSAALQAEEGEPASKHGILWFQNLPSCAPLPSPRAAPALAVKVKIYGHKSFT